MTVETPKSTHADLLKKTPQSALFSIAGVAYASKRHLIGDPANENDHAGLLTLSPTPAHLETPPEKKLHDRISLNI